MTRSQQMFAAAVLFIAVAVLIIRRDSRVAYVPLVLGWAFLIFGFVVRRRERILPP